MDENHDKVDRCRPDILKMEKVPEDWFYSVKWREETGFTLIPFSFRGIVTFISDNNPAEYNVPLYGESVLWYAILCDEGQV